MVTINGMPKTEWDHKQRPASLMYKENIWAHRIPEDFHFEVGKRYLRLDGKIVTIIAKNGDCVQGDDGADCVARNKIRHADNEYYKPGEDAPELSGFRYDRTGSRSDLGRCTGCEWDDPHNLIPFALQD